MKQASTTMRGTRGVRDFFKSQSPGGTTEKSGGATMYPQPRVERSGTLGTIGILNYIALKGRCLPPGFYNALSGLGNLKCNANPGFRSQARFTLGCEYSVAPRLFFSAPEERHICSPVRKRGVCGIFLRARVPEERRFETEV